MEAVNKLHIISSEAFSQDSNFVSFHKLNKKRKFSKLETNQNTCNPNLIEEEGCD